MLVGGDNKGDPELVAIIANGALDSANWLTYEGGVSWKHDLMQFGGHNIKRSIIPITHSGLEMTTKLTNRVNWHGATIVDAWRRTPPPSSWSPSDAGAVTGVKVENPGDRRGRPTVDVQGRGAGDAAASAPMSICA